MIQAFIDQENLDLGVVHTHLALIEDVQIPGNDSEGLGSLRNWALQKAMGYSEAELDAHPVINGHRLLLRSLGYSKRKARPAPERLILSCRKRQFFPKIMPPVDAYNSVVVEYGLGIGAHDADLIEPPVVFTRSRGGELFTPILQAKSVTLKEGDYIYRDSARVLGRLACEDCDEAKITPSTRRILIVSEGNKGCSRDGVRRIVEEACQRIVEFCGGRYEIWEPTLMSKAFEKLAASA